MATAKAPVVYQTGHVKQNLATGSVAVRTVFDSDQFPNMMWLIATTGSGAQNASAADVDGWVDLFTPAAPAAPSGDGGTPA